MYLLGSSVFPPNISLVYNSQQGNSTLGMGWSVFGIPMIVRGGKTIYYDGKAEGIKMDNDDSFMLNGVRLIKTDATSDYILYESEQGNIKAKGFISGTTMTYFEVFFPNGDKGVFGSALNSLNMLSYPIFSLKDIHGNTIRYEYTYSDNHYDISWISYNGCYVEFQYAESREDPILTYGGGKKIHEPKLLKSITSKYGEKILCTYTLSYSVDKKKSFLASVGLSANGKSFNPISFYYGEGLTATSYTKSETQLLEWYESDDPNMIKVVKGKFDYDSDADGLIVLPNKNPYWKHYRHSTALRHSQNRFDNLYSGDEKIFLYAGLKDNLASPMPNLLTESGFVDIITGDLEGKQEENVIKINDLVVNNTDQVTFNVYRSNLYSGLARLYTRKYNFPTVYTDADDGKSIQPKYYYTGDFNGDGRMDVLATSIHQPFGDTGKPSKCYVFDLVNDKILFQDYVFPLNIDFVGVQQSDPDAASNNSDKLLVMDYDGDGKTDICHINGNGVDIYTFETSGSKIVGARKTASYTGLNKAALENRRLLVGEFNGDGLMDLLVSPSSQGGDSKWTVYNSKGNGQFDKSTFSGTTNGNSANAGFVIQDVNSDGTTDLISYSASGFFTYLASDNNVAVCTDYCNFPSTKSILVPTNINSRNSFTRLVSLKEGKATKYSFSSDYGKESLLTGVANSLGVIEKNCYSRANEEGITSGVYQKGYGATYPYVNIHEPMTIIVASETYVGGKSTQGNSYHYKNAVMHRQGLGFCGFEEITSHDNRGRVCVRIYDPNRRGVVKSESTPTSRGEYEYSVTTQANRLLKILLNKKTETDLLKDIKVSSYYSYDTYGYPTKDSVTYSDGTASSIVSGNITRKYLYTPAGLLSGRSVASPGKKYQDISYTFNAHTLNMMSRKDNLRDLTEDFKYDNLNRLTSFGDKGTTYDCKGNITSQSDVGSFEYDIPQKPYAVSGVTLTSGNMPICNQEVEYTSFSRPKSISENGYTADFSYSADYERTRMAISRDGNDVMTRYYMGDCYELESTSSGNKERLYLGGDYYSAPAVLVKENGVEKVYNVLRDNLGSVTHVIAPDDSLAQELSYDAWGRLRDPATLQVFEPGNEPELFLGRGYTGHEHLTRFGLINMNARLYDAALGRFLSPDPYVQMPDFSQNFNRYSYCMNNPLKYVDKDGKLFWLIAAAVVGAYIGGVASNKGNLNPFTWNWKQATTYLGLGVGAVLGYSCAYGLINPGTLGYTFGINNSVVGAGLTIGGAGSLNNWNLNWSTKAGGGGNISLNINPSKSKENDSRFFHGTQYEASKWLVYTSKKNDVEMAMYKTDYGYYFEQSEGYVFSSKEMNRDRFAFVGTRPDGQYIYYAHNALDAGTLYSISQRRDGKPYLDLGMGQQFDVREMYHTHPRSTPLSPGDPLKNVIPTYAIGWDGVRRGNPVVVDGGIMLDDVVISGTRIK